MTTKAELLELLESIDLALVETSKRPTIMQRLKFFLAQKTVASWVKELANIKATRKAKIKQLHTRKDNINKALEIWLDVGDVIGKYAPKRQTNEW